MGYFLVLPIYFLPVPSLSSCALQMGRCDGCRKQGYMTEKLQCLGSVRNFCNMSCLLLYCYIHFETNQHTSRSSTGAALQTPCSNFLIFYLSLHINKFVYTKLSRSSRMNACQAHRTCFISKYTLCYRKESLHAGYSSCFPPTAPTQPQHSSKMNPVIADVVSLANGSATQPSVSADTTLTG